jgi:NAD(P)-dependent dehydrogenase (short-subunit alcohol dehydrogenase family)
VIHFSGFASKAAVDETVRAIKSSSHEAHSTQADLRSVAEIVKLFDEALKRFGRREAEFAEMFDINTETAFFFIQESGRQMEDAGKIITILTSLLAAFTGNYATYAGSKATVEHFTRPAAKELGGRGISVNSLSPGPMDTPLFSPAETPEAIASDKEASVSGRLTEMSDLDPIVRFLVTEEGSITGQILFADGGYTTR